jgi:hypothetical protein
MSVGEPAFGLQGVLGFVIGSIGCAGVRTSAPDTPVEQDRH